VRRLLSTLGIAALGIFLSGIAFVAFRNLETRNAEVSFNGMAQERLDALETNISLALNNLVSIGALFDHANGTTRKEFDQFTAPLLARTQAVQGLEWIPRVPRQERSVWEEQVRSDGFSSFEFTERLSVGHLNRAGERNEYFPVFYVAPFHGNEKALGFDLASDPVRLAALRSSAETGQLTATGRIVLIQETSDQYGFLVFRPVYRGAVEPPTSEARRNALVGFALAVFRVADIVQKPGAISRSASGLNLAIFDRDARAGERLLYPKGAQFDGVDDLPRGFQAKRIIAVGGRNWELVAYPLSNSFRPARWSSSTALIGGILLTFLLAAYLVQHKRAEESLRLSEERARLLFATIPYPAFVLDMASLKFLEVNDAAVQQYGYTVDEFLRMNIAQIGPAEDAKTILRYLRQRPSTVEARKQSKHVTKSGSYLDVEISFHKLNYGGRKARLVVAQDVTERNRLEINLRHAQKLEAVGSLAAGIAHEINTPIQFISDNTRFLRDAFTTLTKLLEKYRQWRLDNIGFHASGDELTETEKTMDLPYLLEEIPKAIAQSLDGVTRVATLVSAMKDFAHPDRRESAAADINAALRSTLTVARNELKYVADVETELAELPLVICNIGEINQVLLNLLINAAHAIADGKKETDQKGIIRIRTSLEDDAVLISISDSGCGIPKSIRERIFDPFFTTKEVGRGTGQGLAIARSVVVRHGGTINFTSEPGKGTTFCVRLPLSGPPRDVFE